ncbi:ribonuclease H [Tanacetum coccineum]
MIMALKDKQQQNPSWVPTEIIIEILLKLPVESLLRCATTHKISSCNGLLCNVIVVSGSCTIFIWNPSTRRVNRLPSSGEFSNTHFEFGFGFDELEYFNPYVGFGFWYDESNDDYKVVELTSDHPIHGLKTRVKIYSLKSGYWKRLICDLTCDFLIQSHGISQAVNKSPTHYPCDSARTFRVILFSIHNDEWKSFQCHHQTALRSYALSWKPCQGDSLNLPDHRIHKDGDGDASFQLKSDSLPHAHAQTTKTFYKHQDSRIMKAQELKTKTSAQTLIYKIFLQRYQVYQGRLLASFQDDAKYEHVGQDTRSQGGKDDQDGRIKI